MIGGTPRAAAASRNEGLEFRATVNCSVGSPSRIPPSGGRRRQASHRAPRGAARPHELEQPQVRLRPRPDVEEAVADAVLGRQM